jgi:class 3 adenylate cyclase
MLDEPTGTLSFLFCDIEGSTRLLTRLGDAYRAVHDSHQRVLRQTWQIHGGQEVSTEGDSFFVVFASASRALQAAADAHRSLAAARWPEAVDVKIRIGIHTGTAIRIDGGFLGLDVNRAARIAAAGHGGQTLVSEAAGELPDNLRLTDLGRHRLKDVGVEHLWQLDVDGLPTTFGRLRALDEHPTNLPSEMSTLVDRAAEVADIAARIATASVVTVTGPGGIGKSRIVLRVARDQVDAFPDGAFYLDVASIDTADRAADRLLDMLELPLDPQRRSRDTIAALLRARSALIVLDNADRVSGITDLISSVARACDRVRLLVSRRRSARSRAQP